MKLLLSSEFHQVQTTFNLKRHWSSRIPLSHYYYHNYSSVPYRHRRTWLQFSSTAQMELAQFIVYMVEECTLQREADMMAVFQYSVNGARLVHSIYGQRVYRTERGRHGGSFLVQCKWSSPTPQCTWSKHNTHCICK